MSVQNFKRALFRQKQPYTLTTSLLIRRCYTAVAWPVTAGITDTLCICSELSVWFLCDFFVDGIYRRYRRLLQRLVSVKICWISTFRRLRRYRRHFSESFTKFSSARDVKGHSRSSYDSAEPEVALPFWQRWKNRSVCACDGTELEVVLPFCQRQKKCSVCVWWCRIGNSLVVLPKVEESFWVCLWWYRAGSSLAVLTKVKESFHMCVWWYRVGSSLAVLSKTKEMFRMCVMVQNWK